MARSTRATSASKTVDDLEGVRRLGDASDYEGELIPSGILPLDVALGGGFAKGKVIEIFGPEASGKSAISQMTAARAQEHGAVVYVDLEDTLDPRLLELSGVDIPGLRIIQPDTAEEAFDKLHNLAEMTDVSLVVLDSVASMVPEAELQGDMSDGHMMILPRIMSDGLKRLTARLRQNDDAPTFIFINQIREKQSMNGMPSTTSTGGRALKFYSSYRIDARHIGKDSDSQGNVLGFNVKATVVKNKFAPPYKVANFKINYEMGVMNEAFVAAEAVKAGYLQKSGSWFKYPGADKNFANGEVGLTKYMREHPDEYQDLLGKVTVNL